MAKLQKKHTTKSKMIKPKEIIVSHNLNLAPGECFNLNVKLDGNYPAQSLGVFCYYDIQQIVGNTRYMNTHDMSYLKNSPSMAYLASLVYFYRAGKGGKPRLSEAMFGMRVLNTKLNSGGVLDLISPITAPFTSITNEKIVDKLKIHNVINDYDNMQFVHWLIGKTTFINYLQNMLVPNNTIRNELNVLKSLLFTLNNFDSLPAYYEHFSDRTTRTKLCELLMFASTSVERYKLVYIFCVLSVLYRSMHGLENSNFKDNEQLHDYYISLFKTDEWRNLKTSTRMFIDKFSLLIRSSDNVPVYNVISGDNSLIKTINVLV